MPPQCRKAGDKHESAQHSAWYQRSGDRQLLHCWSLEVSAGPRLLTGFSSLCELRGRVKCGNWTEVFPQGPCSWGVLLACIF